MHANFSLLNDSLSISFTRSLIIFFVHSCFLREHRTESFWREKKLLPWNESKLASADWLPIKIDVFLENDMGACSGDFIFYYVVIGVKWSTHIAETIIDRKGDSIVLGKRKPPDRRNESALKEREREREREREICMRGSANQRWGNWTWATNDSDQNKTRLHLVITGSLEGTLICRLHAAFWLSFRKYKHEIFHPSIRPSIHPHRNILRMNWPKDCISIMIRHFLKLEFDLIRWMGFVDWMEKNVIAGGKFYLLKSDEDGEKVRPLLFLSFFLFRSSRVRSLFLFIADVYPPFCFHDEIISRGAERKSQWTFTSRFTQYFFFSIK